MRFTPEELAAIVEAGQISDPDAATCFLETLIERQHKSARYYLNRLNPIDEFEVTSEGLQFVNLSEEYGFSGPGTTYRFQWSVFDNRDDSSRTLQDAEETGDTTLRLPDAPDVTAGSERYLLAEVHAINDDHPMWNRRVGIYLRPVGETFEVVGIERESDPPDNLM